MPRINAVSFHENPSIEAICHLVRGCGFDSLEVSRPPFYHQLITRAMRQRFLEWASRIGLSLYGFDCWVEVDPYERRHETLYEFQRAVDWAADLNLGMLITHDPWASTNGTRSASQCLATSVAMFREVARMCAAAGLRLIFEPHPDTLSIDNSWAIEFVDAVGDGQAAGTVGILYDCCHYAVGQPKGYVQSIEVLGNRIGHVHLSDGDGTTYALHLPLGEGSLDLGGMIAALKSIPFQATLTNDLYNYPLLEDGARRNAARVREVEDCLGLAHA